MPGTREDRRGPVKARMGLFRLLEDPTGLIEAEQKKVTAEKD